MREVLHYLTSVVPGQADQVTQDLPVACPAQLRQATQRC